MDDRRRLGLAVFYANSPPVLSWLSVAAWTRRPSAWLEGANDKTGALHGSSGLIPRKGLRRPFPSGLLLAYNIPTTSEFFHWANSGKRRGLPRGYFLYS